MFLALSVCERRQTDGQQIQKSKIHQLFEFPAPKKSKKENNKQTHSRKQKGKIVNYIGQNLAIE